MITKIDRRPSFKKTNESEDSYYVSSNLINSSNSNRTSESVKDNARGRVRLFKIDGKTVAYFIGQEGKMTKDVLTKDDVRFIHLFFARNHVSYLGKISQNEIEEITR